MSEEREGSILQHDDRTQLGIQKSPSAVAQVAEGIRWMQKHPVLAAVIWVFGKVVSGTHPSEVVRATGEAPHENSSTESLISINECSDNSSSLLSGQSGSRGRLSWSDEYGGSLAEYYEPRRNSSTGTDELVRDKLEGGKDGDRVGGGTGVTVHHCHTFYKDMTMAVKGAGYGPAEASLPKGLPPVGPRGGQSCSSPGQSGMIGGMGSCSPQWGWYVSTTPPQDAYPQPYNAPPSQP